MDSGESREHQRGNARDAERRRMTVLDVDINIARDAERRAIVLAVDLNVAPQRELMDLNEHSEVLVEGQRTGNARRQAVVDVAAAGDDDVEIISPRTFAEATRNSRRLRNHSATEVTYDADGFLLGEFQLINPREETDFNVNLATNTLLPPPVVPESNSQRESSPTFVCGICRGELVEETSTKCGHIFCKTCIHTALNTRSVCPTCRKRIRKKSTFRVFLPKLSNSE